MLGSIQIHVFDFVVGFILGAISMFVYHLFAKQQQKNLTFQTPDKKIVETPAAVDQPNISPQPVNSTPKDDLKDSKDSKSEHSVKLSKSLTNSSTGSAHKRASASLNKNKVTVALKNFEKDSSEELNFNFEGWMSVANFVGNQKFWKRRYFVLKNQWLIYYKTEDKRADRVLSFIKLNNATIKKVYDSGSSKRIDIVSKSPLFFRHGPNRYEPPASRKVSLLHYRSRILCLRISNKAEKNERPDDWIKQLQTACASKFGSSDPDILENSEESEEEYEAYSSGDSLGEIDNESDVESVKDLKSSNLSVTGTPKSDESPYKPKKSGSLPMLVLQPDAQLVTRREVMTPPPEKQGVETDVSPKNENREGLLSILSQATSDLTRLAIPISLIEPSTFMQRMMEGVYCYDLLKKASECEDVSHSLVYISAFAATAYASKLRTWKPFNPYLGETFQWEDPKSKFSFFGEQISHHPPVGAGFATIPNLFKYWEDTTVNSKFGGNSMNVRSIGNHRLYLEKQQQTYEWGFLDTVVHNVILGGLWLDHFGDLTITNLTTGEQAKIEFRRCGWFGKGRFEMRGWILAPDGSTKIVIDGKWNEGINATYVAGKPFPSTMTNPIWTNTIWKDSGSNNYGIPDVIMKNMFSEKSGSTISNLLPTDARLRKDRIALENGDSSLASQEKRKLEDQQRALNKTRESSWKPKHFVKKEPSGGNRYYEFKEGGKE